ncbi:iron ABC transporter permease [Nocardioides phosphati]|uniref:Iron ABC transporter permease n=1 Tax=Nocardioides phosphati TaxID=1867775 RepID=A0ABQ2N773_9ACTN|nr:iron ABC transporter permease [Nocardioides phosphati]GGO85919.1 iron ABC transporter permease [Nocardioides phosphati]
MLRHLTAWPVVIAALGGVAAAALAVGVQHVPLATTWQALTSYDAGDGLQAIVREQRLPRLVLGLVAGASLGLAGALLQGLTRNPIADPGLLGINAGASLAVVVAMWTLGVSTPAQVVWFAVAGALVAAVVVYGAASLGFEGATPVKLALVGAALTATLSSVVAAILLTDLTTFTNYRFWMVGALVNRPLSLVPTVAPLAVPGLLLAFASARFLNAMALGEDVARSLGFRVERGRLLVMLAAVLLSAAATALAGPVVFVGLIVPHAARALVGIDYRLVLPLTALLGPLLLLGADVVGRVLSRPQEFQAGLVVAFLGAPVLIWLVRRGRQVAM